MYDEQEPNQDELVSKGAPIAFEIFAILTTKTQIEDIYYQVRDSETGLQSIYKKSISKSKRNCFTGAELVTWIVQHKEVHKFIAEQIGQSLVDRYLMHKVNDESNEIYKREDEVLFANDNTTYRFQEDDDPTILNFKRIYSGYVRSHHEIIQDMTESILFVYKTFVVNEDGAPKPIDYKAMKKSKEYRHFVNTGVELQMIQLSSLKNEKDLLCLFTNLYNILLFHVCIDRLHPTTISGNFQMNKSFRKCGYWIDGHKYSLSDIENGILRVVFGSKDSRKNYAIQNFDAGIHFLLLDRFKSFTDATIPLKLFTTVNVFSQMQELTELLCNSDEVKVQISKKTIILPKIFDSFKTDFGNNKGEVLHWIASYVTSNPKKKEDLLSIIEDPQTIVLFYDPFEGTVSTIPADEEQVEAKIDEDDTNPVIEVQETRSSTRIPNYQSQSHISFSEPEKEPKPVVPSRSQTPNLEWKTAKLDKNHPSIQRGRSFMIDRNSVYTKASISSYRSQSMDSANPPSEVAKDTPSTKQKEEKLKEEKPKESPEGKKEDKGKRRFVSSFWGGKESIKQTLAPLKHIFDRKSIEKDEDKEEHQ